MAAPADPATGGGGALGSQLPSVVWERAAPVSGAGLKHGYCYRARGGERKVGEGRMRTLRAVFTTYL